MMSRLYGNVNIMVPVDVSKWVTYKEDMRGLWSAHPSSQQKYEVQCLGQGLIVGLSTLHRTGGDSIVRWRGER